MSLVLLRLVYTDSSLHTTRWISHNWQSLHKQGKEWCCGLVSMLKMDDDGMVKHWIRFRQGNRTWKPAEDDRPPPRELAVSRPRA